MLSISEESFLVKVCSSCYFLQKHIAPPWSPRGDSNAQSFPSEGKALSSYATGTYTPIINLFPKIDKDAKKELTFNFQFCIILIAVCTCPLGGMVNTSPSQGEDYGFDPRSGYQLKFKECLHSFFIF